MLLRNASALAFLEPASGKVLGRVPVVADPHEVAVTPDGRTAFVASPREGISVIEGVAGGPPKFKVTAIPVPGKTPEGIDLSPDGRELWTATRGDGGVSIIDTASRKVVQSFNLKLIDANRLKFTPDGKVLILDGGAGTLVVVDAASRKEIKRLKVAPGDSGDGGILVMPDGSRAYLGLRDDHSVVVIDLKTLEIEQRLDMGAGSGPGCITWAALR